LSDNYDLFKIYFAENMMNTGEKQFLVMSMMVSFYEIITKIRRWDNNILIINVRGKVK